MKKLLLFLTVFLFFGFLIAEDVKTGEYDFGDITVTLFEEREPEPEPEKAEEAEPETKEKTKFFYVQPVLGIELGNIAFGTLFNLDIDFLVAQTKRKNNIYLGLDLGMTGAPYYRFITVPLQANITFDFKQKDPNLNYVSLWMSIGAAFNFWVYRDYSGWKGTAVAWRTGLSMIFVNDMVIKIGLDRLPVEKDVHNLRGLYLSLIIALGYRF
ncbi:hypothetical protein IJG44_09995 [bacterium]|nr:hypothetical protein [bacterium]